MNANDRICLVRYVRVITAFCLEVRADSVLGVSTLGLEGKGRGTRVLILEFPLQKQYGTLFGLLVLQEQWCY
jgi:hypothetical protein